MELCWSSSSLDYRGFGKRHRYRKEYAVVTAEDKDHISAWFFNPKRPSSRWNGIGNKPRWYKELEAQGEDMNKYRALF